MEISGQHEAHIKQKIASGKYTSADEVLDKALAALDEREQLLEAELAEIDSKLKVSEKQFRNGQFTEYTDETLNELFDRVKRRGRERLATESAEPSDI